MHKLTSYHLKIIAIITMIIDHTLKIFSSDIIGIMQSNGVYTLANFIIFTIILSIGRISFPLFAYMIAEGCHYTKNIKKYITRLLLLGVISEIPFQFMISILNEQPYHFSFTIENVFFTLALGAISIELYRYLKDKYGSSWIAWTSVIICVLIAYFLNTDYNAFGVLLIFLCFFFRETKYRYIPILLFSITVYTIYSLVLNINMYGFYFQFVLTTIIEVFFSLLSLLFICNYNHERGKSTKWFFYLFYPIHISILICLFIFTH